MNQIQYIDKGNALEPMGTGNKLILHCVNDQGKWGAGFVLALSKKWEAPERAYHQWAKNSLYYIGGGTEVPFALGFIQAVGVGTHLAVVNMVAQEKTGPDQYGFPPIRYWALDECLKKVATLAKKHHCSIHVPYLMGCNLAGGEWDYVELILKKRLENEGIEVIIYDFEGQKK